MTGRKQSFRTLRSLLCVALLPLALLSEIYRLYQGKLTVDDVMAADRHKIGHYM